ncbi:hypothetical protein ACQ7HM_19570 [Williamsia sp. MIQD14]|uniref:hypothetical protein n=1 Tax=Williamsia sp. MIQD14 TaxID=3425703 RepID=UPI003DA01193
MTDPRTPRTRRRLGAALIGAAAAACLVAGCAEGVDGTPVAASGAPGTDGAGGTSAIDRLALSPSDFPSDYPATRLRSEQAGDALADLAGRPLGGTVDPASCLPPQIPSGSGDTVVVTGMSTSGGNLTVVTTRAQTPLSQLSDLVSRCGSYTADIGGVTSRVTQEALPASPVDSQASIAFRRVSSSGQAPVTLTQTTTVLAAQNDGIRVYASYLSFSGSRLDGAALDAVFTKAVERSRGR